MPRHIRMAFFEGTVSLENRSRFETIVNDELVPGMEKFPKILSVEVLWATEIEDPNRNIMLCLRHEYDEHSHINEAITSDARRGIQPILDRLMPMFDGHVYHVNYRQ